MERGKYIRTQEIRTKGRIHQPQLGKVAKNKGIKLSEEQRKNISILTKNGMTPEVRLKISKKHKGRVLSQDWKEKIRKGVKGKQSKEKHYNWKGGIVILDKVYSSQDVFFQRKHLRFQMEEPFVKIAIKRHLLMELIRDI